MAGGSLLLLLDDIATVLDDVALMTQMAAKKTAGVLGDDLALNARQVAGVRAERELPVVWAVAVGSLRNKAILVPAALAISAIAPWAVLPLLMAGGLYLCFEGAEKVLHRLLHGAVAAHAAQALAAALNDATQDLRVLEAEKIRGAVRTDFVLSAEIIVIALGTVVDKPLGTQVLVLAGIGVLMTVGVYGFVAAIVKLDDLGLLLSRRRAAPLRALGTLLLHTAPRLMKALTVVGTAAMFLVGGSIVVHGLAPLHHATDALSAALVGRVGSPTLATLLAACVPLLAEVLTGLLAGAAIVLGHAVWERLRRPRGTGERPE